MEICGKLAIDWREISDLGDRVSSQSVEVKFSNVLAKQTITAQSCGNIINLLRQLQVDIISRLHRNDLTTEDAENAEGENTEMNNSDATGFEMS